MSWRAWTALYGGIGGVFAPLLTVAQDLQSGVFKIPSVPAWLLGLVILFAPGAVLAWMAAEKVPLKALAIGVSLPAAVTVFQQNGVISKQELARPSVAASGPAAPTTFLPVFSTAHAQQARSMVIEDLPSDASGLRVWFFGKAGQLPAPLENPTLNAEVPVPAEAQAVAIEGPDGWSLPEPLPASGQFRLDIEQRSEFSRSFQQAFGGSGEPYELEID